MLANSKNKTWTLRKNQKRLFSLLNCVPILFAFAILVLTSVASAAPPAVEEIAPPEDVSFSSIDLLAPPQVTLPRKSASKKSDEKAEPQVTANWTPHDAKAGDLVTLSIHVAIPEGSYTYSMNPSFGGHSKVIIDSLTGVDTGVNEVDAKFVSNHAPKSTYDKSLEISLEKFYKQVTWTRRYRLKKDATSVTFKGTLKVLFCDANTCKPLELPIAATLGTPVASKTEEKTKPAAKAIKPLYTFSKIPSRQLGNKTVTDPVEFTFSISPEKPKKDDVVTLSIHAKIDAPWHIFATTQDPKMAGLPTKVIDWKLTHLVAIQSHFQSDHKPEIEKPLEDIVQKVHYKNVTWTRKFRYTADDSKGYGLSGKLKFQLCKEGQCQTNELLNFQLGSVQAVSPLATIKTPGNNPEKSQTESSLAGTKTTNSEKEKILLKEGFFPFLVACFVGGLLALLTPCVFPMIPITVSVFLKKAEQDHHSPVFMASVYALGMIIGFTGLGLLFSAFFGTTSLNSFANNFFFNFFLAGMLIFFGLNFLGMFELQMPSWLLTWSSKKESQGGVVGILFMALTFTLVSFTCTFAIVATLLGYASSGHYLLATVGMLTFSIAFASPFFFLALFPSYLNSLPKSGGWMNRIKVTFGLIEIGAAFKFLSVMDPGQVLFDYSLVMTVWMVIAFIIGVYLLGTFQFSHDTPSTAIPVTQFGFAVLFLALGGYISIGMFGEKEPTGVVWKQIKAFAPTDYENQSLPVSNTESIVITKEFGPYQVHGKLPYALDVDKAITIAKKKEQPLFLDFTGVNCTNCRLMENTVMKEPKNKLLLKKFIRAQLYVDTKTIRGVSDPAESIALQEKNLKRQTEWLKDVTLPAYVVATSDGKNILHVFRGGETIANRGAFNKFLKVGLEKWEKHRTATKADSLPVMR